MEFRPKTLNTSYHLKKNSRTVDVSQMAFLLHGRPTHIQLESSQQVRHLFNLETGLRKKVHSGRDVYCLPFPY